MGLCRVLAYLTAGAAASERLPPALWMAALVALSYLIGLTYVAKQETLRRVENLWPLLFLAAPLVYLPAAFGQGPVGALVGIGLLAWVSYAIRLLLRPGRARVKPAVVSLIAGISLVDAVIVAAHGHGRLALFAVLAFLLTLALQRFVEGT
jgi:4-hydroxybenzoate polyprenyltransferase